MKKSLISLLGVCLFTAAVAHAAPQESMGIQIIQQKLNLTKDSFKSIRLIKQPDGTNAVEIVLKPKAAKKMYDLTESNIKKEVNIVWKNTIVNTATIQSPLGGKFQIMGFNNEQATSFLKEMQP